MRMQLARAGALLAVLAATASSRAIGQHAPAPLKAMVGFRVVATLAGEETHSIGEFRIALAEGGSTTANIRMKLSPAPDGSPCGSDVNSGIGPATVRDGPLPLWQVEGDVRRVGMDDIRVEYAWKRWSKASVGSPPDASYRGEAHLSEGGRALLDFVPTFEESSGCWHNVALELSGSIQEDPAFKDRRIGYDLWLVSEDHGQRLTRRLQLIGKQGENVAFDYGAFRSKLPVPRPGKRTNEMEMTVTGSVRSRIQPDGSLEVLLAASREAAPSDRAWATYAHGSKRVRAKAGETLRLELPPPRVIDRVDELETFKALAEQHVALILTSTLVD
jgi:hypothetical protein